jgi:tetratricopeptide (TPR) repeat protein
MDVENPDLKLRLGLLYIEGGEYDKAMEEFRLILAGNPGDDRAKYYLAVCYIETGQYDTAISMLDTIPQYSEFYDESLVQKAYIFEKRNMLPRSLALMEDVYSREPNNEVIVNYLGNVYRKSGRNEDAVNLYKKFLEANPKSETIYYSLGVTYYLIDREQDSIDTMRKLIEINPKHSDALNFVGYSYAEKGENLDEAEALIRKALALAPNKGYILDSLGWVYYKKRNYPEAIRLLKQAAALQSDDPAILEHLGDAYRDMGDTASALEYYNKGLNMLYAAKSDNPEDLELRDRLRQKIDQLSKNPKMQSRN